MKDNQIENINKYLDNEMSINERTVFEKQLRNDKELAEELAFYKDFHGFAERRKPALRQDLSDLGDKFIIEPNKNKRVFFILDINTYSVTYSNDWLFFILL